MLKEKASQESQAQKDRPGFFARHFGSARKEPKRAAATTQDVSQDVNQETPPVLDPVLDPLRDPVRYNKLEAIAYGEQLDTNTPTPDVPNDPLDGLAIDAYCAASGVSTAEVWRRLRAGELTGRTEKGRLLIYSQSQAAYDNNVDDEIEVVTSSPTDALPPLPSAAATSETSTAKSYLALTGQRSESPELAMLIDHLSIAKEENREILRMTQEAIRKVSELSENLVEMKDAVIEAKELQIKLLQEQLTTQSTQVSKLKQQKEDLEMLTQTLASQTP